jgi:hypothetical protein
MVSYFPHIFSLDIQLISVLFTDNIKLVLEFFVVHVFLSFPLIILNIIYHWCHFFSFRKKKINDHIHKEVLTLNTIKSVFTLTCASRNVSDSRPWAICRNPVRKRGRKIPVTDTWSPGNACRVVSPRHSTVRLRGMLPTGTASLCNTTEKLQLWAWFSYLLYSC